MLYLVLAFIFACALVMVFVFSHKRMRKKLWKKVKIECPDCKYHEHKNTFDRLNIVFGQFKIVADGSHFFILSAVFDDQPPLKHKGIPLHLLRSIKIVKDGSVWKLTLKHLVQKGFWKKRYELDYETVKVSSLV